MASSMDCGDVHRARTNPSGLFVLSIRFIKGLMRGSKMLGVEQQPSRRRDKQPPETPRSRWALLNSVRKKSKIVLEPKAYLRPGLRLLFFGGFDGFAEFSDSRDIRRTQGILVGVAPDEWTLIDWDVTVTRVDREHVFGRRGFDLRTGVGVLG